MPCAVRFSVSARDRKYGPFARAISIAIFRNTIETGSGPRDGQSSTINPRRFKDNQTGEWKDGSFRPTDLPVILLALQSSQQYMAQHPLSRAADLEEQDPEHPFRRSPFALGPTPCEKHGVCIVRHCQHSPQLSRSNPNRF
jgi:hypothetical protein